MLPIIEALEERVVLTQTLLQVTSLADTGAGTLRALLAQAQTQGLNALVEFAPNLAGTISLSTPLTINNDQVAIQGTGPHSLTIRNANNTGIFDVAGNGVLSSVSELTLIDSNTQASGTAPGAITAEVTTGTAQSQNLLINGVVFETTGTPANASTPHDSVNIKAGSIYGSAIVAFSTFLGNSSLGTAISSNGIEASGLGFTVYDSTFEDYTSAIKVDPGGGGLNVFNSTFEGNNNSLSGAAISADPSVLTTLTADTFANNVGSNTGGVVSDGATGNIATIQSSIVYGNTITGAGSTLEGRFSSSGYNDLQSDPGFIGGLKSTDLLGTNPLLAGLGDYGGSSPTDPPEPGSSVLTKGAPGAEATDERGNTRSPTAPSIGAEEGSGVLFTVNSTGDNGGTDPAHDSTFTGLTGTLRKAIVDANFFQAGTLAVQFAIPSTGTPQEITLANTLDTITAPVVIDGSTQNGFTTHAIVKIQENAVAVTGLTLAPTVGISEILDLSFDSSAGGTGIRLQNTGTSAVLVEGVILGHDPDFADVGGLSVGIRLTGASNDTIGGVLEDDRDVFSGAGARGIDSDSASNSNLIEGSYFGTAADGVTASPFDTNYGIVIAGTGNTIGGTVGGAGNVIGGVATALEIDGNSNLILGNSIGVNALGGPLPDGVGVVFTGHSNTLGGASASGAGNLVENATVPTTGAVLASGDGIFDASAAASVATSNVIQGNTIESNQLYGIYVELSAASIGGTAAGQGNTIAANAAGGVIVLESSRNGLIQGNTFGVDVAGVGSANGPADITLEGGSAGDTIGGLAAGQGNLFFGTASLAGILIDGDIADTVEGNQIGVDFGSIAVSNENGIVIRNGSASVNVIGNTIAGATNDGVEILGSSTIDNVVSGNLVHDNTLVGIYVAGSRNTIGGSSLAAGNVLYSDGSPTVATTLGVNAIGTIQVDGASATSNLVEYNDAGYDVANYLGSGGFGLALTGGASNNTLTGNVAGLNYEGDGILIDGLGTSNNLVTSNDIGTDETGANDEYNNIGLEIENGASSNNITFNVISGNENQGVYIHDAGTTGNTLFGDFIGTALGGTALLQSGATNSGAGIEIGLGASSNRVTNSVISGSYGGNVLIDGASTELNQFDHDEIGTNQAGTAVIQAPFGPALGVSIVSAQLNIIGPGDVISGNLGAGVSLSSAANSNQIIGDVIGLDGSGTYILRNLGDNIVVASGSSNNTIGGTTAAARDVISGLTSSNTSAGVLLTDAGTTGNVVEGNFIGLNASGNQALGNSIGVLARLGATSNTIGGSVAGAGNVISGNVGDGILVEDDNTILIQGNLIGTNLTGKLAIGNATGLVIEDGSSGITVGGTTAGARNVISGNTADGIDINNTTVFTTAIPTANVVEGDYIGTDITGEAAVANANDGISIDNASVNTIGGTVAGARNVISGNGGIAVLLQDTLSVGNIFAGNDIGTDALGSSAVPNAGNLVISGVGTGNVVGLAGAGNVISGSAGYYEFYITGAPGLIVQGNKVGTNAAGTAAIPNANGLVVLFADNIVVGGTAPGAGNLFSGNVHNGMSLGNSTNATIQGNLFGTDITGNYAIGNGNTGLILQTTASLVGGLTVAARNLFSGNGMGLWISGAGVQGNLVEGNFVGTAINGMTAIPNQAAGIEISATGLGNTIGSTAAGGTNVISGNLLAGIDISGSNDNLIQANQIGVTAGAKLALGNAGYGVLVEAGSVGTTIGGLAGSAANAICATATTSGVYGFGIGVTGGSTNTVISGNVIGGLAGFGNASGGIDVTSGSVTIGGNSAALANLILGNGGPGIAIGWQSALLSTVAQDRIAANAGLGIAVDFTGDAGYPSQNYLTTPTPNISGGALNAPAIGSASIIAGLLTVSGFARPGSVIEFDAAQPDPTGFGQGAVYLGTFTEGSANDSNASVGSYSNASGSDTNAARFTFTFAIPAGFSAGTVITAISDGTLGHPTVSEYGKNYLSDLGGGLIGPVLNAGANATILVGQTYAYRGAFGDDTSANITASVNYGDGSGVQALTLDPTNPILPTEDAYTPTATGYFELNHVFSKAGTYPVLITLTDDDGLSSTTTLTVNVKLAPAKVDNTAFTLAPESTPTITTAPAIVPVDLPVLFKGKFTDPNPGDVPTVEVIWGDGRVSCPSTTQVGTTFSFSVDHSYLAPSSNIGDQGLYPVSAIVTTGAGLASLTIGGLFYSEVLDTAPVALAITPAVSSVAVGGSVSLAGSFVAPHDAGDVYHVAVNWGDGSSPTKFDVVDGSSSFNAFSGIVHQYLAQPIYLAGTPDAIKVTVTDQYQPLAPASATASVAIVPSTGSTLSIATDHSTLNEGGTVSLSGTLAAAVPGDPHNLVIQWGDGTSSTVPLAPGQASFSANSTPLLTPHRYPIHGSDPILVTVTDPERPDLKPATASTTITVLDVAPSVSLLAPTDLRGNVLTQALENSTVVVTGSYTNPGGVLEHDGVTITWGDGTTSTAAVNSNLHTFTASHKYGQVAGSSQSSTLSITATATDSTGLSGSSSTPLVLAHLMPTVTIGSSFGANGQPLLSAPVVAGGDTASTSYTWTIGSRTVSTTANYVPIATPGSDTTQVVSVSVKVTAVDGYATTIGDSTQLDLVDDYASTSYAVPAPTLPAGSSVVIDVVGNKTLVGGTLVSLPPQGSRTLPVVSNMLTTPISFDGNGNETYVGDSAADTFNLHSGTSIAYGMANGNTFDLTPNCNLSVVASSRQNTLNYSGSSYGVQFDLTMDAGQPQYVDPLDPTADHVVSINDLGQAGAFSTLIDSNDGDKITAAAGSTIVGGGGMDSVILGSSSTGAPASNVTVDASTQGNVITATAANLGNFTFNGDANPLATGPVSFLNQSSISNASFYGDQGTTTFGNASGATASGSINFTGDQGTTTFNNAAGATSTGTINFSGDQATSTLNNGAGSTLGGMINFTGDQASSTFNNGPTAVAINFNGDQATSTFGNGTTTTNATVNFTGDQATTTFNNGPGGTATGTINFGGDQASSTFNNGVSSGTTTVNFGGDQATSTLSNGVSSATVNFTGDQATTTFNNGPGSTQSGTVNFGGDQATSTFNNGSGSGSATVQINYGGDQATSTFTNSTTSSTGTINFSGDGGASYFNNGPNATFASTGVVSFSGDQATSTFNNGLVAIAINYGGDQSTSTLGSGASTAAGTINFTGDQATTTFNNGPGGTATGTINFGGDQASSTFNNGVSSGTTTVNFGGDQATSTLSNGVSSATVNFTGDQATTTFNNGPGSTQSGTVNFGGDQATSTFNNGSGSGSATVQINYGGDQATSTFTNSTTSSTGTINFAGDGGASSFNNGPGATQAGLIEFVGDQATNTFNNAAGGSQTGTISFGGDQGYILPIGTNGGIGDQSSNTFNNAAGASSSGTINYTGDQSTSTFNNASGASSVGLVNFTGDQATNTFNNAAGGSQTGTINYGGDQSTSTFSNAASGSGTINFGGDGNAELDWNQGAFASGLNFAGSAYGVSSTLVNTGTIAGNVSFAGNAGVDAFYNGAVVNGVFKPGQVVGSILIGGGTGSGTFVNDGSVSGSITLTDKASSIGSLETLANLATASVGGSLTLIAAGGSDTLQNSGTVGQGVVFRAGNGTNTLENDSAVGSIQFVGNPTSSVVTGQATTIPIPTNEVLNTAPGVASLLFTGGAGGNLLKNTGGGVGSIVFTAFGVDSVLENSGNAFGSIAYNGSTGLDSLINSGNANLAGTSTIAYSPAAGAGQATDTLENSGANLASIVMLAGSGVDQFSNTGSNVGLISFHGGTTGGVLLNSGSNLGALDDVAGGGLETFNNGGTGLGSIGFQGTVGVDSFYNTGSAASLAYAGGSGGDTVINSGALVAPPIRPLALGPAILIVGGGGPLAFYNAPGATLSGIDLVGAGAFGFENAGTLTSSTIDATGATTGQFLDDASGTLVGDTYKSSPGGDTATSYGSINGFTFVGGAGAGTLDLYGPQNQGITYLGGTAADSLIIGTYAGNVSGIVFDGGAGADLLASDAANVSNVTLNGGLGSATFWSLGAYASGLTLVGGAGVASLDNSGAYANNLSVVGGSGGATLYNTGNAFGTLSVLGGSGANVLTNTGLGTSLSALDLTGGVGDNTLTNAGNSVGSLLLQDGPGLNAIDAVVNSGVGVGSIVVRTNAGVSSLINTASNLLSASGSILTEGVGSITDTSANGSPSVNNSGGVGALNFQAGAGDASLVDSGSNGPSATIVFLGGGADDTFIDSATAASAWFNAGKGGSQVVIQAGATGSITLVEGLGNDSYTFEGSPQAAVVLNPPSSAGWGVDTLDFSSYLGGGLVLDLMKTAIQAIAGGLSLTLGSPTEITHVVGTQFTNTVYGNTLADTLDSANLPDATLKSTYTTPSVPNAKTQWAYLDFTDDVDPVAGQVVHSYTAAEQQAILQAVEADYWGPGGASSPWFNVDFTTAVPNLPAGSYATLYFNDTPASGQPGGQASEVDFGNLDAGGSAAIQVNGLLGGQGQPTNTTSNFDTLSAKIAAHEFAHLLGVRHSDAFGPIGFGIHTPPGSSDFNPSFSGPNAAFESFDHLISSPATEGTDRFNDLRPLDFGPREAIKLAFGEQGTIVPQASGAHSTMSTANAFTLGPLSVPNTDVNLADIEQGMTLQVLAGAVAGSIAIDPQTQLAAPDYFSFSGKQGDDFTLETESQELPALADGGSVDTVIEVFDSSGNPVSYYGGIAQNDDQFEGSDSLLDDVILPATGTYYVKVTSFAAQPGDPNYDPTNPASPLSASNTASTLNPANPAYSAAARAAYIAAGNGTATGQFDLFIYKESQADPLAKNVNNVLVARTSGSTLVAAGQGDTLVGAPGTDSYVIGNDTITVTATPPAASIDLQTTGLFGLTISDTAGQSSWPVTINYGDGTSSAGVKATSGQSLAISHLYPGPGTYTVTVSYTVGGSLVEMTEPVNLVETQAPTSSITALPAGTIGINTPATFSASLQNPYLGTNYTATWTFTNQATLQKIVAAETVRASSSTASLPFTLSEGFATAGTYLVQLTLTNTLDGLTSTATLAGGVPTSFTIVAQMGSSVTVTLPTGPTYYTAQSYVPPSSSIVVKDSNNHVIVNPSLTYTYTQTINGVTTPLANPPIDAGTYQLVVHYAGDTTHLAAQSLPVSLTISPATPTVSLTGAASQAYNASAFPAPTITVLGVNNASLGSSGVTLAYSQVTTQGLVALAGSPKDAGSYQVVATDKATTDYALATSAPFSFTITQATSSVTLSAANATYTSAAYAGSLTTTVNGSVATAGISFTYYNGTSNLGSAAPKDAGTYSVTATYAGSTDYASATSAAAPFIVSPATLTDTINDASKVYGQDDHASLGGVVAGLLGTDSATATYTSPGSVSTADVGSYAITASLTAGGVTKLSDYAVTYANKAGTKTTGTLTVTQAMPTVTLTASSTTYTAVAYAGPLTTTVNGTVTTAGITYTYYSGSISLGSAAPKDAGSYSVTATYAGSIDYSSATSAGASFAISSVATTITGSASAAVFGSSTTLTGTVKASAGSPVGSVDFYDTTSGVDLGSATVNASGVATLSASLPPEVGSQTITLTYKSSSPDFNGSTTTTTLGLLASIYVLNPTASGSLNVSGSSVAAVPGTIQVASNSPTAIILSGNTKITAPTIGVGGGTSVTGSSTINGTLTKGVSVSDPLAGLPVPSASGLTTYPAVNIGGVTSQTISPGIYPSINVGASARLTMLPGIYIITGGGFTLSGAGVVTGSGVFLYNAGSNYNGGSGSTFGAFNLSAGSISLTPMTAGPYAGIALFQSRDNTRALSISGSVAAGLGGGAIYAPTAILQLSGSASIGTSGQSVSPLIVNQLSLTGNTGAYQRAAGAGPGGAASTFNWITDPVLTVSARDDAGNALDPAKLADLGEAMAYLNRTLGSFGVELSWAPSGTNADVIVHFAASSPVGGAGDGVLGYTTPQNNVYFVTGRDEFTGSDPGQIGSGQYDFTTLAVHELAHTLGLGESLDPASVLYEYLAPGTARRTLTTPDLEQIDGVAGQFLKVAPASPVLPSKVSIDLRALDSALAALDPNPDAASSLSTAGVHRIDAAIESVVEESYFIPLEIAQGFTTPQGDDASPASARKTPAHLA